MSFGSLCKCLHNHSFRKFSTSVMLIIASSPLLLQAAKAIPILRPSGVTNVTTYQNNNARTGINPQEWLIRPSLVKSGLINLNNVFLTDGPVYAEPLLMSREVIPLAGLHNILYVATAADSLFAFDADNGATIWSDNFGLPVAAGQDNSQDITPSVGITGTPVIDERTREIFLVSKTTTLQGNILQQLHAINIITGAEEPGSPVTISATVAGTGDNSQLGIVSFDPLACDQRGALLLTNGNIIIPETDVQNNHGWVLSYDEFTLAQNGVFCSSPNGFTNGTQIAGGSVGFGGAGPAADTMGDYFVTTGLGFVDPTNPNPSNGNFEASLVKFTPSLFGLTPADFFTPFNEAALTTSGLDPGTGGCMVLPSSMSIPGHANLITYMGENGTLYMNDIFGLGRQGSVSDNTVEELQGASTTGAIGAPALCNNDIYYGSINGPLTSYGYSGVGANPFSLVQIAQSTNSFGPTGTTPAVSGIQLGTHLYNGVIWAIDASQANVPGGNTIVDAYDPLTLTLLNSFTLQGIAPTPYSVPVVANGYIYVPTQDGIAVLSTPFIF